MRFGKIDDENDSYLEAGAVMHKVCETDEPAYLFNNMRGKHGLWQVLVLQLWFATIQNK